jgi:hypothetical protein
MAHKGRTEKELRSALNDYRQVRAEIAPFTTAKPVKKVTPGRWQAVPHAQEDFRRTVRSPIEAK